MTATLTSCNPSLIYSFETSYLCRIKLYYQRRIEHINSFYGETSYNDTMALHLVPTTATLMQLASHNPS